MWKTNIIEWSDIKIQAEGHATVLLLYVNEPSLHYNLINVLGILKTGLLWVPRKQPHAIFDCVGFRQDCENQETSQFTSTAATSFFLTNKINFGNNFENVPNTKFSYKFYFGFKFCFKKSCFINGICVWSISTVDSLAAKFRVSDNK